MTAFEVLTMGRIGVDLYPQQVGVGLDEVESFGKYLGGSASNVAVAAARYGRRTAVITRTGADPFGKFLHTALRGYGVDDRYVTPVKGLPTPVTFCEIFPPDDFPLYFYRLPKAPDLEIYPEELDLDAIRDAGVFWVTVTGLSEEPSRTATLAALQARARKDITVLDLDYRPMFWPSREEARRWVQQALPHVTVAVGNLDECETAVGEREPLAAAQALHGFGVKLTPGREESLKVFREGTDLAEYLIDRFLKDAGDQGIFVLVVTIECRPVDHRPLGNVPHGDCIEPLFLNQVDQGFAQDHMGSSHA